MFLLFAGQHYYPSGGWKDYAGKFDTVGEAIAAAFVQRDREGADWWHIVDAGSGSIVSAGAAW